MRYLLTKTLYDKRGFTIGWSAGIALMVIAVLSFFPAFSKEDIFSNISEQVPPAFAGLLGDVASFTTITGYIATQLYDIRIPLFLMILGLVLAQSLTIGDEEKGTLRTLLSTPLSRSRVILEKWLAATCIIAMITLSTMVASYLGVFAIQESPPHELVLQLGLLTFLFGVAVVTVPFGVGLATGSRALTMTIGILSTIGSFILSSFATAVDWLKPWEVISLMYYYDAGSLVKDGFNYVHISVLVMLIAIFLSVGFVGFNRRDVSDS